MARGAKVNIWKYIDKIAPFLKIGCSIKEACLEAEIPEQTVYDYMQKDEEVRAKIDHLSNFSIVLARKVWIQQGIEKNGDWRAAKDYLERKRPEEFASVGKLTLIEKRNSVVPPPKEEKVDLSKLSTLELHQRLMKKLKEPRHD